MTIASVIQSRNPARVWYNAVLKEGSFEDDDHRERRKERILVIASFILSCCEYRHLIVK